MLSQEHKGKETSIHYSRVRDSRLKIQGLEANILREAVGIPNTRLGRLEDVPLYENFLKVGIVVLSSRIGNKRVYGSSPLFEKKIFIYHTDSEEGGHFDTITKVNAMMYKSYYCSTCDKAFQSRTSHKCRV